MKKLRRKKRTKNFQIAYETRNLEINLFWKRYGAFWIIVAAAFVGFAALKNSESIYSLLLASFGFISSFAWTLMNRGSKYWQETWEDRAGRNDSTGFFQSWEPLQKKNFWSAKRFSVSKLAIILSDFVVFCWLIILGNDVYSQIKKPSEGSSLAAGDIASISSIVIVFIFLLFLLIQGRSTVRVIEFHDNRKYRLELRWGKYYFSYFEKGKKEKIKFKTIKEVEDAKVKFQFITKMLRKLPNDKAQI